MFLLNPIVDEYHDKNSLPYLHEDKPYRTWISLENLENIIIREVVFWSVNIVKVEKHVHVKVLYECSQHFL